MKTPRLKDDMVSVQDLRAALASWIDHAARSGRPVVVTQRGKAAAVILSPAALDDLEEERELLRKTLRSLKQIQEGKTVESGALWRKAKKKLAAAAAGQKEAPNTTLARPPKPRKSRSKKQATPQSSATPDLTANCEKDNGGQGE